MKRYEEKYFFPRRSFLRALFSIPLATFLWDRLATMLRLWGMATPGAGIAYAAPQAVAKLSDLSQPWSAVHFSYPMIMKDLEGEREAKVPGIVIRLPDEQAKAAAQLGLRGVKGNLYLPVLLCPHEKCVIFYRTDRREVERELGVEARTPMISCPCHRSSFDPVQDGKVLSGPAPRPPWKFEFIVKEGKIIVLDLEPGGEMWANRRRPTETVSLMV